MEHKGTLVKNGPTLRAESTSCAKERALCHRWAGTTGSSREYPLQGQAHQHKKRCEKPRSPQALRQVLDATPRPEPHLCRVDFKAVDGCWHLAPGAPWKVGKKWRKRRRRKRRSRQPRTSVKLEDRSRYNLFRLVAAPSLGSRKEGKGSENFSSAAACHGSFFSCLPLSACHPLFRLLPAPCSLPSPLFPAELPAPCSWKSCGSSAACPLQLAMRVSSS